MIYEAEVIEVRSVRCRYRVEASRLEEAYERFEEGDTVSEEEVRMEGVLERQVVPETVRKDNQEGGDSEG